MFHRNNGCRFEFVGVGGGPVLLQQYFQYAFICCPSCLLWVSQYRKLLTYMYYDALQYFCTVPFIRGFCYRHVPSKFAIVTR